MKRNYLCASWDQSKKKEFGRRLAAGVWKELHARGYLTDERLNHLLREETKAVDITGSAKRKPTVKQKNGDCS